MQKAADTPKAARNRYCDDRSGDYQANSAFGIPIGYWLLTANSDGGSFAWMWTVKRISGIAPEYARMSVYGAIKGDGVALS